MAELREAVRLAPDDANVLKIAAWVAATSQEAEVRSAADAVNWSERAVKLAKDQDASILDCLAAAYAEAGRFPDAKTTAQKAFDLAHSKSDMGAEARIHAHLDVYRSGKPLREPPSSLPQ